MEDETEYMLPIFIPHLQSPMIGTEFQHSLSSPATNEDSNRNLVETTGFFLHLTFNGNNRGPNRSTTIQLASQSTEDEAKRCQEQLDTVRQNLLRLETDAAGLERANEVLRSDNEFRELMNLEQNMKRLKQELVNSRALAIQSKEDLTNKLAAANASRTKRFEAERALRELQLCICRRKLEYATARALDDTESSEDDLEPVSNLPEEEERITSLQRNLTELSELNIRAVYEVQEAERLNATRQSDLIRTQLEVEKRISMGENECAIRRQSLTEKRHQLERNISYLATVGQEIAREKISEIELLQQFVLIEAARKLDQLERNALGLMSNLNTPYM